MTKTILKKNDNIKYLRRMQKTQILVFLVWTQWCSRFGKVSQFFIVGPSHPMPKGDDMKIQTYKPLR